MGISDWRRLEDRLTSCLASAIFCEDALSECFKSQGRTARCSGAKRVAGNNNASSAVRQRPYECVFVFLASRLFWGELAGRRR